ncbi:MAG TPA: AbrB/MazE/SpoVT family DNA-binding domain-containing protein [Candidatus Limnocylindrales bacterium]|nr:AbrB/MazE/SpoVT family DNA-binding domain-containing protein [Candidatus Limnocylindrales bacterium]
MSKIKVGKHGRITIPAEIRKKLGIKEGDISEIKAENGKIILTSISKQKR